MAELVTLQDVAVLAGLSLVQASSALHGSLELPRHQTVKGAWGRRNPGWADPTPADRPR